MAKPFDATMRDLVEIEPAAWLRLLGLPVPDPADVRVVDSNLAAVAPELDKLVRVGGPRPFLFHPEFLSGRAKGYPGHLLWYNANAGHRHELPVLSVLILLRPAADGPELTGEHEVVVPFSGRVHWFAYRVVRVWELPADRLLAAGLPVLPLAAIAGVPAGGLSGVLAAVAQRLRAEAGPELRATLWAATEILLGLYHPKEQVRELTREVSAMILGIHGIEESSVYQDIFAQGEARGRAEGEARGRAEGEATGRAGEARRILFELGRRKFGEPGEPFVARVVAIDDPDELDALVVRVLQAATWDELLAPIRP